MAAGGAAPPPPPPQLGSLWSTLEDQRCRGTSRCFRPREAFRVPRAARGRGRRRRGCSGVPAPQWRGGGRRCARADSLKAVFAAKVWFALALISLLVFLREPRDIVSHSLWAILTVVLVFEFSIGATLSKGFNRRLRTLTAGGLALAVAEMSKHLGKLEEVIFIMSTFIVAFCTTLTKLHPKMKVYAYGFCVFLLTFCNVMVSGYNTETFTDTAVSRFVLIALGAAVSLGINIGIY